MKRIYLILLILLGVGISFTSCKEEDPFSTATADDEPRIIAPTFPELDENGNLKTFMELDRDVLFSVTVTTTPADYTSVVWYLDGLQAGTEKTLEMYLNAGLYNLKVLVSTPSGKQTSRETLIKIKPLTDDPQSEEKVSERLASAGSYVTVSGSNLGTVKKVSLQQINVTGNKSDSEGSIIEIQESDVTADPSGSSVSFKLPAGISVGTYRVTLIDADGNEYGANTLEVARTAMVKAVSGNNRPDTEWTLTGMNLDEVASLTVGDVTLTSFVSQSSSTLRFICPNLEDGKYKLTGKTKDGENLKFLAGEDIVEETEVLIEASVVVTTYPAQLSSGSSYKLIGRNIDLIASLSLNGLNAEITEKNSESVTFNCPELENGEYTLSGKDVNGRSLRFNTQEGESESVVVQVSNEIVVTEMWSGHHYLSWDLPDGDPNKTFTAVQTEVQNLPVGTKLKIYYSLKADDSYHKMGAKTAYWGDLPGYAEFDVYEDGVLEIIITQEIIDKLSAEAGFIMVGFGVYIDRVTYE